MTNPVTLAEVIEFMERRCVGVDQSADEARWKLIHIARAHDPNALDAPDGNHGLSGARQGGSVEPRATTACPHCREVYEIWAGMEGFTPETAPEAYQQRIIDQMREAAAKGVRP